MDRERAKEEIKQRWRELYPADRKGGIICPRCGSGSGPHGTGITEDKKRPGQLHCFACGFDGDILSLIQQDRGADFKTALEYAAAQLSIPLDDLQQTPPRPVPAPGGASDSDTTGNAPAPARSATPPAGQTDNGAYYERCREQLTDPAAAAYLQARGISLETARRCGIGFDRQQRRLIIPLTAQSYTGRAIDTGREPRYKNTGKAAFFREAALYDGPGPVFITEGAIDALSILQAGGEAIALNSVSNAEALLRKLEARPPAGTLLLCLDNDEAGTKAARLLSDGLQRLNVCYQNCGPMICGEYKDPNERLTTRGGADLAAALQEAIARTARPDNTSFYLDALMQGEIDKFREGHGRKTGFANLDKSAGGLYPGLYVIAAISSLGKTSFALQIADQIAAAGTDVIFFSLEQSRLELVSKSLARIIYQADPAHAVTALKIRQGYIFDETLDAIADYKEAIQDRLSIVEGNFSCNVSYIREYTRQYMQRTGTKPVIFIDYLQILQGEADRRQSTKDLIDSTITELKRISRELDITVFVISSLNRMNYLVPVSFEALKESGSIEYSADVIYGLQLRCINDDLFNKEGKLKEKREKIRDAKAANPREIELLCLKNRYGISSFSCYFDYYPANDLFKPAISREDAEGERL